MKKPMFSVFDKKAEMYTIPFLETTDGTAIRFIQDQITKDTPFARYPGDFRLDKLGEMDEKTGVFNQESKGTVIELQQLASGE
jgi:hypothetical protein